MKFNIGDRVVLRRNYPITKTGWTGTVVTFVTKGDNVVVEWDNLPDYIAILVDNNRLTVQAEDCDKLSKLEQILK